jgi:hypothetical protein
MQIYASSASIVACILSYKVWKIQSLHLKTIALAILALIPEFWIWFGEIDINLYTFLVLPNFILLITLVVLVPFCIAGKVSDRLWLILFFCKGMIFFILNTFVISISMPFAIQGVGLTLLYYILYPLIFLIGHIISASQMLSLGYIWLWKEKKLKQLGDSE